MGLARECIKKLITPNGNRWQFCQARVATIWYMEEEEKFFKKYSSLKAAENDPIAPRMILASCNSLLAHPGAIRPRRWRAAEYIVKKDPALWEVYEYQVINNFYRPDTRVGREV